MLKKHIFRAYNTAMKTISKTGIARRLLPLSVRKGIGRCMRKTVSMLTALDTSKPYEVFHHKMWFLPGSLEAQAMAFEIYERDTVEVFKEIVKPGMTFVDVGAFVGYYTLLAARLVGTQGRVYAFEPNPHAFAILRKNVEENQYDRIVRTIAKAVSNRNTKMWLFLAGGAAGEASLYPGKKDPRERVEVETTTLDEFFAQEGWPKVHVVKIDVEGAEVEVLEGMREIIARNPDIKLIIEFNPNTQIKSRGSYEELLELLRGLGFARCYAIRHGLQPVELSRDIPRLLRFTETTRYVNLLCERKDA